MARSRKTHPVLDLPSMQPAVTEPATMPAVTFSPEALSALLNEVTEGRKVIAQLTAAIEAKAAAKNSKGGPKLSIAGKTEKAIQNEIQTVKIFKAKGFGNVKPHVDVKTFNLWMQENRRPIEGSKSVTVNNLRLFHVSQTRPVTPEEKAKNVEQQKAAIDRHTAKGGTVTHLTPQ